MPTNNERIQYHNQLIDQAQEKVDALPEAGTGGAEPVVQPLTVTENGTYEAPEGVDGYSPVTVAVPEKEPVLEALSVTENGTYTPSGSVDGYSSVTVAVPDKGVELPELDSPGSASDLRTGKQLIDGDGNVVEGAMPTATQATPGITVSSGGLITASATQSAGYVAAGTKSATKQLTTQSAKTITPSKSTQTAVASGRYTTGAITVGAIPSQYIVPSGTKSITANGTHDVKSYASVNVAVPTEDLNTVLTEQEALITELETVLAGKAAGGGGASVETCTVEITCDAYTDCLFCFYTCYENGQIIQKYAGENVPSSLEIFKNKTLENVVCGTYVHVMYRSGMKAYRYSGFDDNDPLYMYYYDFCKRTTVGPGETATIEFYDEDA